MTWLSIAPLALSTLAFVVFVWLSRQFIAPHFWDDVPWSSLVDIHNLTHANVSDLLYRVGQESDVAQQQMPILCALCGIAFPPVLDSTGLASVPSNAATSVKAPHENQ